MPRAKGARSGGRPAKRKKAPQRRAKAQTQGRGSGEADMILSTLLKDSAEHPIVIVKESIMNNTLVSIRMFLVMTVLTGLAYPLAVTGLAKGLFHGRAEGSMIAGKDGSIVGSSLIAQKFTTDKYFWPRPSAADYNASSSSGSNYGPTSAALKKAVDDRRAALLKANPGQAEIPEDMLYASGSGLDPDISPAAARYQAARVAKARKLDVAKVMALVEGSVKEPQFGVLGEPRVNVLLLNLALDDMK